MVARISVAAGLIVLIGLAVVSAFQVPVWASDHALWSAAESVTPDRPRVLINLAHAEIQGETANLDAGLAHLTAARIALQHPWRAHRRNEWAFLIDLNTFYIVIARQQHDEARVLLTRMTTAAPAFVSAQRLNQWLE